ncbi:unnamed protein product [Oikopleura dioica]|uniref:ABC transporter domain-containing protein n=1 Tax=Oikopleura dioica TaxID=34765 RepID=E4YVW6_OIKDI|nr:unnamed protein product [Oikopleura dioica]
MLMMGLKRNTLWLATWLFAFFKFLITAFIFTMALFIPFTNNGAVFLVSNWFCFFIFLLSYGVALISLGFFMGALFSTSTSAAVATGGVTFLMFIPYRFLQINGSSTPYGAKILCSLFPPVSLALGLETLGNWEIAGEGVQFSNFFTPISTTNPTNFGTQMVMLLMDTLLYFLLGLYVDTIRPGQWGIPKPWNFFCMPSYWSPPKKNQVDASNEMITENPLEQKLPSGVSKESGFRLRNLVKEFEDKGKDKPFRAVDNLSIDAYQNEITVLLGPNGAGKSTTINMMSGMLVADTGTCEVGGHNITTNPWAARAKFGYCPQFDALLQQLTGRETLYLYARLRGVPEKVLPKMVDNLIELVGIKQYAERPSSTYSGGNKRKLSVAIALTGYPRVTIMDEPSCGLDPGARRQLWSVILSVMKTGASVLLTSHSMEETAALCDELAIMVNGRLRCIGGQQHLKTKFGKGVEIEVQLTEGGNAEDAQKEIMSKLPFMELKEVNQSFISFRAATGVQLSTLFKELQATKKAGIIAGYTVDQPTLEQIFIDLTGIEEK